jgi:phenylpropionate dioxygenase-like ring-hydroxylating dioxygenase large terminal subunit
MIGTRSELAEMVNLEKGTISREVFVNDDIYRREQEQVFARSWLFVGHESQIPNPGDFFQSRMGEESVILVRDRKSKIHVFLNTCRHRGMKVCRYDLGNALLFTCPFHGWSYDLEGKLVGVPAYKDVYEPWLDRSEWGLPEVPKLANFHGSIWASWDPNAAPFDDFLGDYRHYLGPLFDSYDGEEGGAEVLGGVHTWRLPCNWKFPGTSFGGDAAHGAITHRSTVIAGYGPAQKEGDRHEARQNNSRRYEVTVPRLGHACHVQALPGDAPYVPTWGDELKIVDDYYREAHERRLKRGVPTLRATAGSAGVFPNVSYSGGVRATIVVWHPHGTQMTEAWRFYLVDRKAPQEVKDAVRLYHMRYGGPVGMTEQDDMENWNYASNASKGVIARRYPYNYQMSLEPRVLDAPIPGEATDVLSERAQRSRFGRWLEFMEADSWDEIYPKNERGASNGR